MKIKTSELTGPALDYAVAKANAWVDYPIDSVERGEIWHTQPAKAPFGMMLRKTAFRPSTNWAQGGPIIEREKMDISHHEGLWGANWIRQLGEDGDGYRAYGPTPLIAAMRCYVASKLGDEVEILEELIK